jgi:hypothetical protein
MIEHAEDILVCCKAVQTKGGIELFIEYLIAGRALTLAQKLVNMVSNHLPRPVVALFEPIRKCVVQRISKVLD